MKYLVLLLMSLVCFSCSNDSGSIDKNEIISGLAAGTALVLECENEDAILVDFNKWFGGTKIETGESSEACEIAVKTVLPILLKNGVKESWGCKLEMAESALGTIGEVACSQI